MIGVVGLGYVGLTTALGFAYKGYQVCGYESDRSKKDSLIKGMVPFHEPQLQQYLRQYKGKSLHITPDLPTLVRESRFIFFCVGTPSNTAGAVDVSGLYKAVKEVLKFVPKRSKKIFVIKSSVPPTTATKKICSWIKAAGLTLDLDVSLVSNPEFLREGSAWCDFIHAERVVVGADHPAASRQVAALYKPFNVPVHEVSLTTAEFTKYLSNCFLASMISFANEMAMLAEHLKGIDVARAFSMLHEDKRWRSDPAGMKDYVYPGCGFGGYCLPKDIQAVYRLAQQVKQPMPLLRSTITTNARIKAHFLRKIAGSLKAGETVAVLGLAFKPGSDDVRGSVAYEMVKKIADKGKNTVIVHDPMALNSFKNMYRLPVIHQRDLASAVKKADVIVLLTAWPQYIRNKRLFTGKTVIDGRYCLGL